ncbi:hypothetical protein PAEPH01_1879 [Pancytospora epiphaga]|nr:hypothetical protein PAEPH01_1879 [Pancytospora epiphaga]
MARKEMDVFTSIAFLKVKALVKSGNLKALIILKELRDEDPDNLEIIKMIGNVCFNNNMFEEATEAWLVVYLHENSVESLEYVICSVIYTETFNLLFNKWKIHKNCKDTKLDQVIEMILSNKYNNSLEVLIKNNTPLCSIEYTLEEVDDACQSALFERNIVLRQSDILPVNENQREGTHLNRNRELGCQDVSPISSNQFYILYYEAIRLIRSEKVEGAIDILLLLYKERSRDSLLERLAREEKLEILYYLGQVTNEFYSYYERVVGSIRSAKIRTLHTVISNKSRRSLSILKELINIL